MNLVGEKHGRLTVIAPAEPRHGRRWVCRCDCGAETILNTGAIRSGHTRSCGCLHRDIQRTHGVKHGHARKRANSREFRIWLSMKQRCFNEKEKSYPHYGGRGIVVSEEWRHDFAAFFRDMGPCPSGLTIDRIDNNGNYERGNCRWATRTEQNHNARFNRWFTLNGDTLCLFDWARRVGMNPTALMHRLRRGMPFEAAIAKPVMKKNFSGHGSGGYKRGCRCEVCVAWRRTARAAWNTARNSPPSTGPAPAQRVAGRSPASPVTG